ncbi:glycerophosphoryl diester phosphodiesterase membrane domain-containing protein [Streptomyces pseudovenezuelae]|uniref:glycerophosphoryl diester phosphodiesterase membrane domain-containing protein n=1 Tax=Streptomyces pseudovenezuelae TaxID=67350 RepID=UPI002E80F29D|nr:glycerophosphoryl diester phosphodiesterase membrane domain-containing protein [Streptomyces pseudovenezuelae]WUA90577.1 glycerophosphoryl diester phosphodiesterase membrane domain-containing protein [Streptomyces pseudovenezuelae]
MNDTPGWASPGSAPSDGHEPGTSGPAEPAARPDTANPAQQPEDDPQDAGTKWSPEQPPPGQWSAPTGPAAPGPTPPPPPPGPGWGTQPPAGPPGGYSPPPGWGGGYGGWGGPPPAAKPGVIPLRPLGVGEILDGAVSTMRTYWRTVLGISLTVAVVTEVLVILLQGFVLNDSAGSAALNDPSAGADELTRALGETMLGTTVVFLISLIGTVAATALLTTVTSRAVLGRPVTTGEAWRDARPQVPRLFGLIFLLLLITFGVLAVGALPGILVAAAGSNGGGIALAILGILGAGVVALWLMIRFSLASPALMLEKQSIVKSMSRSTKLVRGSWWRVLGIQLLAGIIANIVAAIIVVPFTFLAAALSGEGVGGFVNGTGDLGWTFLIISGIGSVIGSMITFPITAGVTVLLYIDQRIRREALDLELARAAGLQDYETHPTPGS